MNLIYLKKLSQNKYINNLTSALAENVCGTPYLKYNHLASVEDRRNNSKVYTPKKKIKSINVPLFFTVCYNFLLPFAIAEFSEIYASELKLHYELRKHGESEGKYGGRT